MTNQNNAAQAIQEAERIAAADEYFKARAWIMDTNDNRRIFEAGFDRAYALLSKLRAPVADERAAFEAFQRGVGLNELYLERHPESGQYMWTATKEAWETWQARAALASAPVAGEAIGYSTAIQWRPRQSEQSIKLTRTAQPEYGFVHALYAAPQASDLDAEYARGRADGFDAARSAPQASEAVRIVFPAHLRKMWSGGEVQAWLDEHQGVAAPKPSAKGSLERYRKWQAERDEAFAAGVKAAADLVKKMADGYDTDHGSTDPETGAREYPGEGASWVCEMQELEESIRALSAQPGAQKEQSDA